MRITHLTLLTDDLPALRDFYTDLLGLPILEARAHRLAIQVGSSRLTFEPADAGWEGLYHFAFNIPENQFHKAKAWLSERVPLIRDHTGADEFDFSNWNAHSVYFYDPAGNIVEFIARHDLPNASDRPFGGQSVLNISEIGLAADDVVSTAQFMRAQLGVEVFHGSAGDTFAALGDDEGLLILVKRGRVWYPDTGKPADLYPVTASLSVEGDRQYQLSGPPYQVAHERE